jgi:hypothetical protein
MQGLSIDSIAGAVNVGRALRMVTKGTVPSDDGFPTEFYAKGELRGTMVPHLGRLFRKVVSQEDMSEAMKEACITVLYIKGRERISLA